MDRVPPGRNGIPVLDQKSVRKLERPAGGCPIAVMLACYTGAIDASEDSLAEEMIRCEGGPIAVLAGSRVTMPYGNATAAVGLINGVFQQRPPRLGDAWLYALQDMHQEVSRDRSATRVMIDALATLVSPAGSNLLDERREHMFLYQLIGDPTLKLRHPQQLKLEVKAGYQAGQQVEMKVTSPIDGELVLSLDRPLGAVTKGDPNQLAIGSATATVIANQVARPKITLPDSFQGPIIVRAIVSGKNGWASAASKTILRAAASP
ncbi:MAG: C25 family cysteine peptidase [Pirellulales bacterium]|nr:C25 family cysteine peptidase [Pirellulales bacterium]